MFILFMEKKIYESEEWKKIKCPNCGEFSEVECLGPEFRFVCCNWIFKGNIWDLIKINI